MQTFPTYLMNNYPQYPYQPMQNPYMDRLQQLQSQQMVPTQMSGANQGLMARMVDNFEVITANDVPMSGGALFVKSDGSMIEYRAWKADGTISKTQYLAQKEDLSNQTVKISNEEEKLKFEAFNDVLMGIQEDIKTINDKIDKISKPTRAKKEVEDE